MSYLHPPPGDAPVVVYKDVGGYVDQYDRQTALYFQTNREVRLHECRSACTLALALPNVCVYPDSQLKFHKAYNPETRDANDSVVRRDDGGLSRRRAPASGPTHAQLQGADRF